MSMLPVTSTAEAERVIELLRDTVALICKTSLNYNTELSVEGTIGVTLDKTQMFLVNVREIFHQGGATAGGGGEKDRDYLLGSGLPGHPATVLQKPGAARGKHKRKKPAADLPPVPVPVGVVRNTSEEGGAALAEVPSFSHKVEEDSEEDSVDMSVDNIKQEPPDWEAGDGSLPQPKWFKPNTHNLPPGNDNQGFPFMPPGLQYEQAQNDAMAWFGANDTTPPTPSKTSVPESKRNRKYKPSWREDFPWLYYSEAENKMYCEMCKRQYAPYINMADDGSVPRHVLKMSQYPFVKGSQTFRRSVLTCHAESASHKEAEKTQATTPPGGGGMLQPPPGGGGMLHPPPDGGGMLHPPPGGGGNSETGTPMRVADESFQGHTGGPVNAPPVMDAASSSVTRVGAPTERPGDRSMGVNNPVSICESSNGKTSSQGRYVSIADTRYPEVPASVHMRVENTRADIEANCADANYQTNSVENNFPTNSTGETVSNIDITT